jgi:SAM-dependent methyltransferase
MLEIVELQKIPTDETYDESAYLAANPDVAAAVSSRKMRSGWVHFRKFGRLEGRRQFVSGAGTPDRLKQQIAELRARKLSALAPLLSRQPISLEPSGALNFLTAPAGAGDLYDEPEGISENGYDAETVELLRNCAGKLVLDVGAGRRPVYFGNVVNYEIANYETTDVLGDAADLPFRDGSFDGVISIAVLEHVRDPFKCAAELCRVLKPGGWLKCCVPFLQPLHGFPHHYFNMTHEGLRALFEPHLVIERQEVTPPLHPVWSISWQLRVWANALSGRTRRQFLRTRVRDLIGHPAGLLDQPFARELPNETLFELAAATLIFARKPQ